MASYRTPAIPKAKPLKLPHPKPSKMPTLRLPTMKTGGTKLSSASVASIHGVAKAASPRPYSSAISKAASSSSPTAGSTGTGRTGWRNQGRTTRPQQDSPVGFFNQ